MENVFCCVVSIERLYQSVALICSLSKVMKNDYLLFILCVDEEPYKLLKQMKWRNIILIHEKELSKDILSLREQRELDEYCWTLKPVLLEMIMFKNPSVRRVTYVDSDLFFFAEPSVIFQNQPNCSVLLSREEKYTPSGDRFTIREWERRTGKYNSGFISFGQDKAGCACLSWWKEQCLKCCKIDYEKGLFGDQKYCDQMPSLFPNICDITTPGANIGPWNYGKYEFSNRDGKFFVNQARLIFYHFAGLRIINKKEINHFIRTDEPRIPLVYEVYTNVLKKVIDVVESLSVKYD